MTRSTVLDFWDESLNSDEGGWNSLAVSELVDVVYDDEVYRPATINATVQNKSAGGGLSFRNIAHSSASPTVVTNNAHGLETNDRITVTVETSGAIEPKIYGVEKIDANTFYLKHYHEDPRTGQRHLGGDSARVDGDATSTPTLDYVATGKYSIQTTDVNEPDFFLGQEVVLWHFPNGFTKTAMYAHSGSTSALVVTYSSHPFTNGDIIQVVDEDTGAVTDDTYMIANKATNTFQLTKIKSGAAVVGNGNAGNLALYFKNKSAGFPLFSGSLTEVQESWDGQYGKTIVLKGTDRLQFFNNATAKAINKDISATGEKIGGLARMGESIPRLSYLDGADTAQNRFSLAIGAMVDDFSEGNNTVYTDNTVNGTASFTAGAEKHEASGFVLTSAELTSQNFAKDVSESNHKVLRVMQQLSMQDRHYTSAGSATGAAYGSTSGTSPVTITSNAHGLSNKNIIYVFNDSNASPPPAHIPSGLYRVQGVTTNSFTLWSIDGDPVVQPLATGSVSWEGMQDGNFGYDFFLDSGMYGVPTSKGYSIAGNATQYALRPHLNYFKRGYRQFRPDATGLNLTLPMENDITEDGQTRIMYPDATFTVGEDEIVASVELNSDVVMEGNNDSKSLVGLGHSLEAIRISKIACKDNVTYESTVVAKAAYAGEWLGDFHWGRHDSLVKHTTKPLAGRNDYSMFWQTGGTRSTLPLLNDDGTVWKRAVPADYGPAQRRLSNSRVVVVGAGGTVNTTQTMLRGFGLGIPANSGVSGLSELPQTGRALHLGPNARSYKPGAKTNIFTYMKNDTDINTVTTSICDSDLIKSIKNTQNEKLYASTNFVADGATAATNSSGGGSLLITTALAHGLQTGNLIKITVGDDVSSDYWLNYYRVEWVSNTSFYISRPPAEAYEGLSSPPAAQNIYATGTRINHSSSGATGNQVLNWRIVYNVFSGVCRVQYQTLNGRTEKPFTENILLISDRIKKDRPYGGIEVDVVSNRESSDTTLAGLTTGMAVMPDSLLYGATLENEKGSNPVPVRFRQGDRISETRFLMMDGVNADTTKHLFKNTQAVLVQSLLGDKSQSKTEELTYSFSGNDLNEVRVTAAAMLARSSRDLIRGSLSIVEYPFIKLFGTAASGTSSASLKHALTTSVSLYGGRPGMLVHKTDAADGNFVAGVLAEDVTTQTVNGTLSDGETWSASQFYRMYVHLRAGHSVRVTDARSSISSNMIITKLKYTEGPNYSKCRIEVIGFKDMATGFAVKPIGKINSTIQQSGKKKSRSPLRAGKPTISITIQAGTI